MDDTVYRKHLRDALVSNGTSGDEIYSLVLRLCSECRLGGRTLDFGAGRGVLISALLGGGYNGQITGADIMSRPPDLPVGIEWIETDLNLPLPLPDECFDLIIAAEVIEHLENPRATFREYHRLLRPGGTLLLTTPNQESIRSLCALLFGGHFVAFRGASYPAHITALVRLDLSRLCAEAGFMVPRFHFSNRGGIPKLPKLQWQTISLGLLKGRFFSDNLAITAEKAASRR
jgi:2-polyprenyl-3-methyl-5-hydroxy-6-metoxy-1,4-benzoquinol methylase